MEGHTEPKEAESEDERSYSAYAGGEHLGFDPLKDLNLPSSYDEVLLRFKQLQGDRAMEGLI